MTNEENKTDQNYHFSAPESAAEPLTASTLQSGSEEKATQSENTKPTESTEIPNVITSGRVQYAIGLFWQPLQDVDDPIPEIRETMESETGANFYAIHYGRSPQYGIGRAEKGHKEGLHVGAIAVLDSLSEKSSFVAVFKVEQGWWFLVVRNDLILPEEDILYHTEQEAKDAFYSMLAVPDWGYKIAPASWNIDGTEEMRLDDLLKNGQQVRLMSLSAIHGTKILISIAIILFILVGLIAYSVFFVIDKEKKAPTIIEPVTPVATIQTVEPQREEEKPWEKLASVPALLEKCWSDAYQLKSMTIPGWGLTQITCTPQGINTGWNKTWSQGGRIAWIEAAIKDQYKFKGEPQINETGTAATISFKFDDIPVIASMPTLSLAKLRREMTDISQALSLPIALSVGQVTIDAPKSLEGDTEQAQQPAKVYRYLSFSFSSSMDPPAWQTFFDKFNGLEITKIEYNPNSDSALTNNWKYEGRIYEK